MRVKRWATVGISALAATGLLSTAAMAGLLVLLVVQTPALTSVL